MLVQQQQRNRWVQLYSKNNTFLVGDRIINELRDYATSSDLVGE